MHALLLVSNTFSAKKYPNTISNVAMNSSSKIQIIYMGSKFLLKLKQITGFAKIQYGRSKYQSNK